MIVVDLVGLYASCGPVEGEHPLDAEFLNARVRYALRTDEGALKVYDTLMDAAKMATRMLPTLELVIEYAQRVGVVFTEHGFTEADIVVGPDSFSTESFGGF